MEDKTPNGYPLPHRDNIASEDVMRIREAIEQIDADLRQGDGATAQTQRQLDRHLFEQRIKLWRDDELE